MIPDLVQTSVTICVVPTACRQGKEEGANTHVDDANRREQPSEVKVDDADRRQERLEDRRELDRRDRRVLRHNLSETKTKRGRRGKHEYHSGSCSKDAFPASLEVNNACA